METRLESSFSFTTPALARKHLKHIMTTPGPNPQTDSPDIYHHDETKEVSVQLKAIRRRHDEVREENALKQAEVDQTKLEIMSLEGFKQSNDADSLSVQHRIDQLTLVLESVKQQHEDEIQQHKVYLHMLDRMKTDKLSLQLQANQTASMLKEARRTLETEQIRARRFKEDKFQSKQLLNEFKDFQNFQKQKQLEHVVMLEKNLRMREEAARRREAARLRQVEIAEEASAEGENASELRAKDTLSMHRLFYRLMKYKLDLEKEGSAEMERAYDKMRLMTGLKDIQEMARRFLNRDTTYNRLLEQVAEAEAKLDALTTTSAIAREQLRTLQLTDEDGRVLHRDMTEVEGKIGAVSRDSHTVNDRLQSSVLVYDSVLNWTKKIMRKLKLDPEELPVYEGDRVNESPYRLADLFRKLVERTQEICEGLEEHMDVTQRDMESLAAKQTDQLMVTPR
jgi:hypothetical protein